MFKKILLLFLTSIMIFAFLAMIIFLTLFDYNSHIKTISIKASVEERMLLKKIARKIKSWIYHEATIYNPEGDILPDEIDDKVIKEIKERIK